MRVLMEYLGDREQRTEVDHRMHRKRNHGGAVLSSGDVDIRR